MYAAAATGVGRCRLAAEDASAAGVGVWSGPYGETYSLFMNSFGVRVLG